MRLLLPIALVTALAGAACLPSWLRPAPTAVGQLVESAVDALDLGFALTSHPLPSVGQMRVVGHLHRFPG